MKFVSTIKPVGVLPDFHQDIVKNEPMFFSADLSFAIDNGGPITRAFLEALPDDFRINDTAYIDSRVHMLMPGWFPCIPGWHHDDVPRNGPNGQPNYVDPPYRTRHVMALVNAGVAPTEFLEGTVTVPDPDYESASAIYKQWDDAIEDSLKWRGNELRPGYDRTRAQDRVMYEFDCDTFHRGTAAVTTGWRWFGRVSIGRQRNAPSEIRRQVQVYMPTINAGW